jgi:hypothetical protein
LLGVKTPKVERIHDDCEARRTWKRFQMVATLPERDQKSRHHAANHDHRERVF